MKIIKINYLTYYFIILFFLCGFIKNALIIFLIVLIHELGHFTAANLSKYKVINITLYPFGGITKLNKDLNTSPYKDVFLSISGILFQGILYVIFIILHQTSIITTHTYDLFITYNNLIIIFNIIPIYPLDGHYVVNALLNKMFSFQKSYYISLFISISLFLILLITNFKLALNNMVIISFLIYKLTEYIKNKDILFNKFLLERYLNNYEYTKITNLKNKNINDLKINNYTYFWKKNKWSSEKKELENKFTIK